MGAIRTPLPVKLFLGMLSPEPGLFSDCAFVFAQEYGAIDLESEVMPWTTSDYYRDEMGSTIFRKFIFFQNALDPVVLSSIKRFSNEVEQRLSGSVTPGRRRINIDPGYVTEAKVVLASTKDFAHRVYIGEGIYAEVTLRYGNRERSFLPLDHTYFDFRERGYRDLFNRARDQLRKDLDR
jgi:hypothetical protein